MYANINDAVSNALLKSADEVFVAKVSSWVLAANNSDETSDPMTELSESVRQREDKKFESTKKMLLNEGMDNN